MEKEMELLGTLLNNCAYTLDVLADIFSRVQMWSKVIPIVFGQKKLLGHLGPPCQFYKVVFWGVSEMLGLVVLYLELIFYSAPKIMVDIGE